jgi:hypothetical protein
MESLCLDRGNQGWRESPYRCKKKIGIIDAKRKLAFVLYKSIWEHRCCSRIAVLNPNANALTHLLTHSQVLLEGIGHHGIDLHFAVLCTCV